MRIVWISPLLWIFWCSTGSLAARNNFRPQFRANNGDPKLEEFFRKTLELVRPEMKRGSKDLDIAIMDPLRVPDYRFEKPGDFLTVYAYFSHIRVPGLSEFRLEKISINPDTLLTELRFSFPEVSAVGDYLFETSTFGLKVVSTTGPFVLTAKNMRAVGDVQLAVNERGVYSCKSVELQSTEEGVEINMINLADDAILRNILDPRDVYNEYKPRIHAKIAEAFKKMLNFTLKDYKP